MKKTTIALSFAMTLLLLTVVAPHPQATESADGQAVFEAQKCAMCHAVESLGIEAKTKSAAMQGGDLSVVELEADFIAKYLRKEEKHNEKAHKKEIKIDDAEMSALIEWLRSDKS